MEQQLEALRGTVHGLVAAVSAIAATLSDEASADAAEVLGEMVSGSADAGLSKTAAQAMQAAVAQIVDALQVPLRR